MKERRWQLRVNALQQLQRWPKVGTTAGRLRRLNNEEQLVGLGFITLGPIGGAVGNHGGKQEPVTDGWATVAMNPSLKRNPDK